MGCLHIRLYLAIGVDIGISVDNFKRKIMWKRFSIFCYNKCVAQLKT